MVCIFCKWRHIIHTLRHSHVFTTRRYFYSHLLVKCLKSQCIYNNNNIKITKYCCMSKLWLLILYWFYTFKAISLAVVVVLPLLTTRNRQFKHLRMAIINVYYCLCWLKHIVIIGVFVVGFFAFVVVFFAFVVRSVGNFNCIAICCCSCRLLFVSASCCTIVACFCCCCCHCIAVQIIITTVALRSPWIITGDLSDSARYKPKYLLPAIIVALVLLLVHICCCWHFF